MRGFITGTLQALLAKLKSHPNHDLHCVDRIVSSVVQIAGGNVELGQNALKTGWIVGFDSVLIHVSGVDDLQDVLGVCYVVAKCLEVLDIRGRVVKYQYYRALAGLSLVLLGIKTGRVLDDAGNELLDATLLDELGLAFKTVSRDLTRTSAEWRLPTHNRTCLRVLPHGLDL